MPRTYNAANQMTNDGTNTLSYDNNGNLRTVGSDTYTWDRANRLLSVGNHSYVYDGLGNRVQQTVSGVVTDYLNDVQPGLTKLLVQDDGTNVEHFVHAVRGIHAVDDGTDWNFYAQDGLGSVRAIVDDSAVVQSSMSFDPYGNPDAGVDGFAYTGEMRDSNGLQYHRARYYDPAKGIWIAQDFLETPNRYGYVSGNSINRIDPTGLFDEGTCTIEYGDYLEGIAIDIGVYLPSAGRFISEIPFPTDAQRREAWQLIAMRNSHIENPSRIYPGDRLFDMPFNAKNVNCRKRTLELCGPPITEIDGPGDRIRTGIGPSLPTNSGGNCYRNADAVRPPLNYSAINTLGITIGIEQGIGTPTIVPIGPSAGISPMLVYGFSNGTINPTDCYIYTLNPEVGSAIGLELGQGAFTGFVWSTATPDNLGGWSANLSFDISIVAGAPNFGISRNAGESCDYSGFLAYAPPIGSFTLPLVESTMSGTFSYNFGAIPCSSLPTVLYQTLVILGAGLPEAFNTALGWTGY